MRYLYRQPVVRALAVAAALTFAAYFWWRLTATLNPGALAFSLLLLAAEAHGIASYLLFAFVTWDVHQTAPFQLRPDLRVDVYVPTYDEDLDVLEATLTGCAGIAYPHTTYVLDDGQRPEVEALAARLGCRYLTRPDTRHARAGSLNAALPRTDGEFIAVLDADVVPQPDLLDRTLGYFVDARVALVQLPQEFYNRDSILHPRGAAGADPWHEQELFYRVIQPGKNRWNAACWCGSPAVLRRAALADVGGVATETITEDVHTSVRLHARGWKTVYHNEALAFGIAPQTLHAFTAQRLRWAQGTLQLLRSRESPLVVPGLSLAQRLNYLAAALTYLDGYQKLIYLLTPPAILLSGVLPLQVDGRTFLARWSAVCLLGLLAHVALGRGHFHYLRAEQYNFLKMFTFIWASAALVWPRRLGRRPRGQPAPQPGPAARDAVYRRERRHLRPHAAVLTLVGATIALSVANLLWQLTATHSQRDVVTATLLCALTSAAVLAMGVRDVLRRRHERRSYRFPVHLPAFVAPAAPPAAPPAGAPGEAAGRPLAATTENLSRYGVGLIAATAQPPRGRLAVTLHLPDGPLTVDGEVVYSADLGAGQHHLGLRLVRMGPAERRRLVAFLFVAVPRHLRDQAASPAGAPRPVRRAAATA